MQLRGFLDLYDNHILKDDLPCSFAKLRALIRCTKHDLRAVNNWKQTKSESVSYDKSLGYITVTMFVLANEKPKVKKIV